MDGSELLPLVGVLVGALITGLVQVLLARAQSRREHRHWSREQRFGAYREYLDMALKAQNVLHDARANPAERASVYATLSNKEVWVSIHGTKSVKRAVGRYVRLWRLYSDPNTFVVNEDKLEESLYDIQLAIQADATR